ncbi:MAG: hypothetical protein PVH49_15075, partial [Syntrophobacterales bacterium]
LPQFFEEKVEKPPKRALKDMIKDGKMIFVSTCLLLPPLITLKRCLCTKRAMIMPKLGSDTMN